VAWALVAWGGLATPARGHRPGCVRELLAKLLPGVVFRAEWLRSMHFNDRLDLVQSCVRVRANPAEVAGAGPGRAGSSSSSSSRRRVPDHTRPPPSVGRTATHLHGLAAAPALHHMLSRARHRHSSSSQPPPPLPPPPPLGITVLGAGGCSVPAFLAAALRLPGDQACAVDAVELSSAVSSKLSKNGRRAQLTPK
jgi:hypothetical protein